MIVLPQGTKELIEVDVTDLLENLVTLDGAGLTYTVKDKAGNFRYNNVAGQNNGMKALCMIDTTTVGWLRERYDLWIKFNALPEVPVLGPFEFVLDRGPA